MEEERIPVTMIEFNGKDFSEKKKSMEKKGYVFDQSLYGVGFAATMTTAGGKLPDPVILAGHFVKKQK